MRTSILTVDIYRNQPDWVSADVVLNKNSYRLYVNDELMTERTWTYGDELYIKERIVIDAAISDSSYKLQVVNTNPTPHTKFELENLLSSEPIEQETLNENTIVFRFK